MITINYNTNQFTGLSGSPFSDQLLTNFNTEDKKSQSRTLSRVLESMKHYFELNKLTYSRAQKSRSQLFFNCVYTGSISELTAMDISPAGVSQT